jgi:DNA-binding NtrC family response regulator
MGSALEAEQWLAQQAADVILLDLNMPRVDGLAFLESLRQRDRLTPVVILTGVGTLPAAQSAIRLGVSEFLTKPCHLGTLEAALQRIRAQRAERGRHQREAAAAQTVNLDRAGVERAAPKPADGAAADSNRPRRMSEIERDAILHALRRHAGNRSAAARELGISRRTLHYRLVEYRQQGAMPADAGDPSQTDGFNDDAGPLGAV